MQQIYRGYTLPALALFALAACLQWFGASSPDKDWLLYAAHMWIGGKVLYSGIFESNPPLILWIYALPAFLALHVRVTDVHILTGIGLAVSAASIRLSLKVMDFHPQFARDTSGRFQLAWLLVFILVFDISPAYFFDREHIFILCTLPYMLRWMPSLSCAWVPRQLRLAIGLMAGIGFCIKPHCMLVFLGLQLLVILYQRSIAVLASVENTIIYIAGIVYFLLVACVTPAYFSVILPMAAATYSGYNMRSNQPFYTVVALFSLAIAFVDFRSRHVSPWRRDMAYIAGLCLLCLVYALTNNGWGYTFLPLFCMTLLLVALTAWDYGWLEKEYGAQGMPVRRFVFGRRACVFLFCAYAVAALVTDYAGMASRCGGDPQCTAIRTVHMLEEEHAGSFGTITINFAPWTQIARTTGIKWQTRFNHLWMMPALIDGNQRFAISHAWIASYVARALADDLDRKRPEIVLVDASPEFYTTRKHVDLVAYFSACPEFRRAWRHYMLSRALDYCLAGQTKECRYEVYTRIRTE